MSANERFDQLEARILALEATALDEERRSQLDELIDLLGDVKAALRIFVIFGNSLKWTITLGAAIMGAWYALVHWLSR